MRQSTLTEHRLEMRRDPSVIWHIPQETCYREAQLLAWNGRLMEALSAAQDACCADNGGAMWGFAFRCVTETKTVSVIGSWEDSRF